jgi:7-cyano-7-deazaguanine synthase
VSSLDQLPLVVLFGGGIESTTLTRRFLAEGKLVLPVYEHWGLHWEDCELAYARRFCEANACARLLPLEGICSPHRDVLSGHWAVTGKNIPRTGDPFLALEIPLRNLTLLTTAAARVSHLPEFHFVMGTTADNHFRDGTRDFFDSCQRLLANEFRRPVRILTPLIEIDKAEVIRQADRGSLSLSFSCLDPRENLHCGICYKCGRRKAAFQQAGVEDPTVYANPPRRLPEFPR